MITRYSAKQLTWIDLESPTREELLSISDEFELVEEVIDFLLHPITYPSVESYQTYSYLGLEFPKNSKIVFILGKQFLITAHYGKQNPFEKFSTTFEHHVRIAKDRGAEHANFLFYKILQNLYDTEPEKVILEHPSILHAFDMALQKQFGNESAVYMASLIARTKALRILLKGHEKHERELSKQNILLSLKKIKSSIQTFGILLCILSATVILLFATIK